MESILWMDGSKESERDKLKLTFEACNDGEDVAVFRTRQLCVLVLRSSIIRSILMKDMVECDSVP